MTRKRMIVAAAALFVFTVIGGTSVFIFNAANKFLTIRRAEARVREMRYYLLDVMKDQQGETPAFPQTLPLDGSILLESGGRMTLRDLLTDPESGELFVYRSVTLQGEQITFDPNDQAKGERFIIWNPQPDQDGKRIVMTDSLLVERVSEKALDFDKQSIRSSPSKNGK